MQTVHQISCVHAQRRLQRVWLVDITPNNTQLPWQPKQMMQFICIYVAAILPTEQGNVMCVCVDDIYKPILILDFDVERNQSPPGECTFGYDNKTVKRILALTKAHFDNSISGQNRHPNPFPTPFPTPSAHHPSPALKGKPVHQEVVVELGRAQGSMNRYLCAP